MALIYISIAFVIGVLLGYRVHLPAWTLVLALLPLPLLVLRKYRKIIAVSVCCLLALLGGVLRCQSSIPILNDGNIAYYNDTAVVVRGTVCADPEPSATSMRLVIKVDTLWPDPPPPAWISRTVAGKLLVFAPLDSDYHYGDSLQIKGKIETPQQLDDFDYPGYLAEQDIYSTISFPSISVLRHSGFSPLAGIYSLRHALGNAFARVLPEPQASLAQGIILGQRGNIPPEIQYDFSRTGTTHILAISGQNLSILAGLIVAACVWAFGKKHRLYAWLALGMVWLYSLLTGMEAAVVRSAIMVSIFLAADILGRQKSALNGLIFAAALMVGVTPSVPKTASFQLSFLATFGLVTVAPVAQAAGRQWTSPRHDEPNFFDRAAHWITDNLAVTVSVLLVIWPLLVYYFGTFSLIGPVATILLVPVLPAIILTGTAAATLALFIAPVGQAIGWLAWLFLTYLLAVIKGGAALPLVISNLRINYTVIWLYYFILSLVILGYKYQMQVVGIFTVVIDFFSGPVRKLLVPGLLVCAILATGFNLTIPGDLTRVSFLDVGQGDAALIQKGTREILVDGGPDTGKVIAELSRRLPFWDRTIELVVVTHPHADHLTGLLEVARRYHIGQVLYADIDSKSALWLEFQNLLARKKITATAAVKGQNIATGSDLTLDIIRAAAPAGDKDIDSASLVLRIDDRQVSFLLTADISTATENELLQERANLSADVLKVAHHGSATSSSAAFLAVVKPSAAVISVGKNNDYGHPDAETVQRLDRAVGNDNIYRTDINGTVEFTTDGEKLWVRTSKQ